MDNYPKRLVYQANAIPPINDLLTLYGEEGWKEYSYNPEGLFRAFSHSLGIYSCWDSDTLVGVLRAVGDSESVMYIQDILVAKKYRNGGIGKELVRRFLADYGKCKKIVLLTDKGSPASKFYESLGFIAPSSLGMECFLLPPKK